MQRRIFLAPSSDHYGKDQLFNDGDALLNRDGVLVPYIRLSKQILAQGHIIHTSDYMHKHQDNGLRLEYYSLGKIENDRLISKKNIDRRAFLLLEPPVVAPHLYRALPSLTACFEHVYLHNVHGDGYSLEGIEIKKLRKFYWPLPYKDALEPLWSKKERMRRIVVINGSHNPKSRVRELYSKRIEAMVNLARLGVVDLFGYGWNRWWSAKSMWLPYWSNRRTLMSIYQGSCPSKFDILSRYDFCLCFENMSMDGYITEKLFDCLFVGTIPLYLGAPDVKQFIPEDAYIDCSRYHSWEEMWKDIKDLTDKEIESMREAGRDFLRSETALRYYQSLEEIFEV